MLFAVYIGLPVLGLKGLIVFGAALDIALGSVLILKFTGTPWRSPGFVLVTIAVAALHRRLAGRLAAHLCRADEPGALCTIDLRYDGCH